MPTVHLNPDEDLSDLALSNYQLIQKKNGFRFSLDAVLLAHFAQTKPAEKIIDLGCGSGVLPIFLYAQNQALKLTAVEIQSTYAELAKRNMVLNQVPCEIINADFRDLPKNMSNQFDSCLSNPPFFPLHTGKLNPSNEINIARHEIYCTLDDLLKTVKRLLKPKGRFYLIYRPERLSELLALCENYNLKPKVLRFIQPYQEAKANLVLLEAIKGGKNSLEVLPALVIYQAPNIYTSEIIQIYGGSL